MNEIARRVAIRFAGRPIPLNTEGIRRLADDLTERVTSYASKYPADTPLGYDPRFLEWEWMATTLKGRPLRVKGFFHSGPSRSPNLVIGAHVTKPTWDSDDNEVDVLLAIQLNGSLPFSAFTSTVSHALKTGIYQELVHELTHVAEWDYLPKEPVNVHDDPSRKKDYYNSPHEIRAFLRQIIEDILPKAEGSFRRIVKPKSNHDFVVKLLSTSTKWKQIQGDLTPQSEATILKAVYRVLEEKGLL